MLDAAFPQMQDRIVGFHTRGGPGPGRPTPAGTPSRGPKAKAGGADGGASPSSRPAEAPQGGAVSIRQIEAVDRRLVEQLQRLEAGFLARRAPQANPKAKGGAGREEGGSRDGRPGEAPADGAGPSDDDEVGAGPAALPHRTACPLGDAQGLTPPSFLPSLYLSHTHRGAGRLWSARGWSSWRR